MVGHELRRMRNDEARWAGRKRTLAELAEYLRERNHRVDEGALSRAERGERGIDVSLLTDWLTFLKATPGEIADLLEPRSDKKPQNEEAA